MSRAAKRKMNRQVARDQRRAAKHRRYIASPAAKADRARSRTAYRKLDSKKALAAVATEQAPAIERPRWSPPTLLPGEKVVALLSENTQRVDLPNQKADAIVDSPENPIATRVDGKLEHFDLSLLPKGRGWQPDIADLDTRFPASLSDEIVSPLGEDFGDMGVRVSGSSDAGVLVGNGKKVFYANSHTDTDAIVEALPRGAEVSWSLRSPAAPATLPLEFNFKFDVEYHVELDGGVTILKDGQPVGGVSAPFAYDAQDQTVPIKYSITDKGLDVNVDHHGGDFAYPIIVDPYWVLTDGTPAFKDVYLDGVTPIGCRPYVSTWTDNATRSNFWTDPTGTGCRHYSQWSDATRGPAYPSMYHAAWRYDAPHASTIFRTDWGDVTMSNNGKGWSDVMTGIINSAYNTWESAPWSGVNPSHLNVMICNTGPSCLLAGGVDNKTQQNHRIRVPSGQALPAGQKPTVSTTGMVTSFSDYAAPTLTGVPSEGPWNNLATIQNVRADDAGVGLSHGQASGAFERAIEIKVDDVVQPEGWGPACTGGVYNPCPTTYTAAPMTTFEGSRVYKFTANDIVGRSSATQTRTLKIDKSGPEIDLTGKLGAIALDTELIGSADPRVLVEDTPFMVVATDGKTKNSNGTDAPAKDRRSGVKSISAVVNGADANGNELTSNQVMNLGSIDVSAGSTTDCDPSTPNVQDHSCRQTLTGNFQAETGNLPAGVSTTSE